MEALIALILLYAVLALIVLPIWTIAKFNSQSRENQELRQRIAQLRDEIASLSRVAPPPTPPTPPASAPPAPVLPLATSPSPVMRAPESAPPPFIPPSVVRPAAVPRAPAPAAPVINWEQFMGAKLFAWLGGLALFLGIAFFVKYSFEHDLIPPQVRVALGFLLGLALVIGGLKIPRDRFAITAQTLVAAGVVSLYAVTYACNSIYHFAFFGPLATFLLMTLITAAAFGLAVQLEAQVVAVLGLLGGFLTPILLSTGQDNPSGLFGYIALLDIGLVAVALHRRWFHLVPLATAGTVLMMLAWAEKFYTAAKAPVAMTICLGFSVLYLVVAFIARRLERLASPVLWSAVALPLVSFGFAFFFVNEPAVAAQAGRLFGFIAVADLVLLALAWDDERLDALPGLAGLVVFALLAIWTAQALTDALLPWVLGADLGFGALHAVYPSVLARRRPSAAPAWWSQLFPPLSLLLMLFPLFVLPAVSLLLWPAILLVDVLAIGLALASASLLVVAVVLVLTLVATGVCIFKVPAPLLAEPSLLAIIGGFALFFFAASFWLTRRLGDRLGAGASARDFAAVFGQPRTQLPAFSALLPFLLLIMVCARLNVPDPSAVFGLGLGLAVLILGLAKLLIGSGKNSPAPGEWLPACALAGMAAVEFVWYESHGSEAGVGPLAWFLGFYAIFALYPFLFRRSLVGTTGPWAVAALSGLAHFWVVYRTIDTAWPGEFPGLIPAFFALAPLASLAAILRLTPPGAPARLNQLAWFGGVALAFITLVIPIQFHRQWLTVGWALEGAALIWLFGRVPHPGVRATGAVLLVTGFVRLALNHAVFAYHVRGEVAVFNWYLYAYGLAIAALFTAARLLGGPKERGQVLGVSGPALFNTLGTVLAFILLNIEIADYFTAPGTRSLAFQFSGNFARDMSYTIAWALFALGLLGAGIWRQARPVRYAAIALLSVALLKLFFHDLARLEALYRIGTLFAVAVVAILASLAYQRFLPGDEGPSSSP